MDFLESLQLPDLPEQQTRLLLDSEVALRLGYDACCTCGKEEGSMTMILCPQCRRVSYCSEACRAKDATSFNNDEESGGHSAIVCALLQLCNKDEEVETAAAAVTSGGNAAKAPFHTPEAAADRIRSEYESYPATLANVLLEGPPCLPDSSAQQQHMVIHIIGAAQDAELSRGPTVSDAGSSSSSSSSSPSKVMEDYAEALAELVERSRDSIQQITLQFVGPDCPDEPLNITTPLQVLDKRVGNLRASTHQGLYHQVQDELTKPHVVVWFHPGFTVPDYDWIESVQCIAEGTRFLFTSNTEMEAIADTQFLLEQDCVQELPEGLAHVLEVDAASSDHTFFSVNPFSGLRVRQNESLANDLYVKNRWMMGGTIGPLKRPEREVAPAKKSRAPNAALI